MACTRLLLRLSPPFSPDCSVVVTVCFCDGPCSVVVPVCVCDGPCGTEAKLWSAGPNLALLPGEGRTGGEVERMRGGTRVWS